MNIGNLHATNTRTDYAGYAPTGNTKIDEFYSSLSNATEKSDTKSKGEALGLTMIPYSEMQSYGMAAFYSEDSTDADPIIRVSSNYGGEQRYYNVHVNQVDPKSASQLEMFALSCYQDDKGLTDGGSFGSFTRMKVYAGNAAHNGYIDDLQNPDHVSLKINWIQMLQRMAQDYLNSQQTYTQYLDCESLASALERWSQK